MAAPLPAGVSSLNLVIWSGVWKGAGEIALPYSAYAKWLGLRHGAFGFFLVRSPFISRRFKFKECDKAALAPLAASMVHFYWRSSEVPSPQAIMLFKSLIHKHGKFSFFIARMKGAHVYFNVSQCSILSVRASSARRFCCCNCFARKSSSPAQKRPMAARQPSRV